MSRWNVRAESASTIIMWFGSLMAVLITILWISKNIYPAQISAQHLNNDLETLQNDFSDACNSYELNRSFNPYTEKGNLTIKGEQICITTRTNHDCRALICNTELNQTVDLEKLVVLRITKEASIGLEAVT